MSARSSWKRRTKFVREGQFLAEVEVELINDETGWAPYLSLKDAQKLDDVRDALRRDDLARAIQLGCVLMWKGERYNDF